MKLTYFDIHGGRGEAIRLALSFGDIDFDDNRLTFPQFGEVRAELPFRRIPILEADDGTLTQSNAILRYVGKLTGLYPDSPWNAALCDEVMDAVEDVASASVATFSIKEPDALKAARAKLVEFPMSVYLSRLSEMLSKRGDYFVGDTLSVADLKVFVWVRSLESGILDHIPTTVVETHGPALSIHAKRIAKHEKVVAYYNRFD